MVHSCEAITLRTYPFAEANKVVVFLTREYGLLRGVAYGAKRSKSRFGASLEPLTHVRLAFNRREHQELAAIENCEIIRASPAYELSWEQNLHFGYFAELLLEFGREQIESEKLFRLSLAILEAGKEVPISLLARYFEFWILRLEGVLPALDTILPKELAPRALEMLKLPPSGLVSIELEDDDIRQLELAAERLIEFHLEKPLKARKVLKELL
jgi:DNA repair protein RecO (recombination protein O)